MLSYLLTFRPVNVPGCAGSALITPFSCFPFSPCKISTTPCIICQAIYKLGCRHFLRNLPVVPLKGGPHVCSAQRLNVKRGRPSLVQAQCLCWLHRLWDERDHDTLCKSLFLKGFCFADWIFDWTDRGLDEDEAHWIIQRNAMAVPNAPRQAGYPPEAGHFDHCSYSV